MFLKNVFSICVNHLGHSNSNATGSELISSWYYMLKSTKSELCKIILSEKGFNFCREITKKTLIAHHRQAITKTMFTCQTFQMIVRTFWIEWRHRITLQQGCAVLPCAVPTWSKGELSCFIRMSNLLKPLSGYMRFKFETSRSCGGQLKVNSIIISRVRLRWLKHTAAACQVALYFVYLDVERKCGMSSGWAVWIGTYLLGKCQRISDREEGCWRMNVDILYFGILVARHDTHDQPSWRNKSVILYTRLVQPVTHHSSAAVPKTALFSFLKCEHVRPLCRHFESHVRIKTKTIFRASFAKWSC